MDSGVYNNIGIIDAYGNDSDTKMWNSLIDINKKPSLIKKKSVCNYVVVNGKPHILTCYHGTINADRFNTYKYVKNDDRWFVNDCSIKHVAESDELDLGLFEITSDYSVNNMLTFDNFELKLPTSVDVAIVPVQKVKHLSSSDTDVVCDSLILPIIGINTIRPNTPNMPKMPIILCSTKNMDMDDIKNLKGVSGTLVHSRIKSNKIIGMISSYSIEDQTVSIVPSVSILRFLKEYSKDGAFYGLCTIVGSIAKCEFEHEGKDLFGYIIEKSYDIKYNNNICSKISRNGNNIKNGDVVYGIDNTEFTVDDGCNGINRIYDEATDYSFDLETFIALNYKNDDFVQLKVLRESKGEYKDKLIKIKMRPIWTMRSVSVHHTNHFINYKGLIFTELSDDIIEFYRNHNIILKGEVYNRYLNAPYTNDGSKVIVLINLDRRCMIKKQADKLIKLGLPLIKRKNRTNEYLLGVIESVNKHKISDLKNLNECLSSDRNFNIHINFGDSKISIFTDDDRIVIKNR